VIVRREPMKTIAIVVAAAGTVVCAAPAQTGKDPALRRVEGRSIVSPSQPRATIEVSEDFRYAGGQQFVLYGVANAEQHFFVAAAADGTVRRLYWLQFEGYLPDNSSQYRYASPDVRTIGPFDFFVDVLTPSGSPRPNSDSAHMREFMQQHGLKLTARGATVRFVHLTDATKRNELMIIDREALDGDQQVAPDALIGRGMSGLRIRP
jgi:hypothetical protein